MGAFLFSYCQNIPMTLYVVVQEFIMRIRIVKPTHKYKLDEIVEVSRNEAFGLLDSGCGVISKDITNSDYRPVIKTKKSK